MTTKARICYLGGLDQYGAIELWGDPAANDFRIVRSVERQVFSILVADSPASGEWFARRGADGVDYVARPRTWAQLSRTIRREIRADKADLGWRSEALTEWLATARALVVQARNAPKAA